MQAGGSEELGTTQCTCVLGWAQLDGGVHSWMRVQHPADLVLLFSLPCVAMPTAFPQAAAGRRAPPQGPHQEQGQAWQPPAWQ